MKWIGIILFVFLLATPVFAQDEGGLVRCGNTDEVDDICTYNDLVDTVERVVFAALMYIAIPGAVIVIIIGGFNMIFSGGNESKFNNGKKIIQAAIIGLALAFGAWLIVETILNIFFAG